MKDVRNWNDTCLNLMFLEYILLLQFLDQNSLIIFILILKLIDPYPQHIQILYLYSSSYRLHLLPLFRIQLAFENHSSISIFYFSKSITKYIGNFLMNPQTDSNQRFELYLLGLIKLQRFYNFIR